MGQGAGIARYQRGGSAICTGGGDIVMAIRILTGERNEKRAGRAEPAIDFNRCDGYLARRCQPCALNPAGQLRGIDQH